jgi:membrane-associated protease RseP (regulator of RpoE activity)
VSRGSNPQQDRIAMLEAGYMLLGSSSFTGSVPPPKALLEEARSVGASRVILYQRYQQTVSGGTSLALPGSTGGGAESSVGYHGSGTTAGQSGSAVREIPYSVKQYAQLATFWARARPPRVGIYYRPLNEGERGAVQRNGGVVVVAVVTGSPAEKAEILRGDIILRANGDDVQSPEQFGSTLQGATGSISLEVLRNSEVHRITVEPLAAE